LEHTQLPRSTDGYINDMNPSLFATVADAEGHPTWEQAMNGPDEQGYWGAAQKEIATLEEFEARAALILPHDQRDVCI
jgi:hypothetical protein